MGYEVEEAMRRWFHGEHHDEDCVDFQTKSSLYEVKSCNLFNKCVNGNDKRKYAKKPHKKIVTRQLGRFMINSNNHYLLKEIGEKFGKTPKYIFVITIGKQNVWRIRSWELVDLLIKGSKGSPRIRIKDIFSGGEPI